MGRCRVSACLPGRARGPDAVKRAGRVHQREQVCPPRVDSAPWPSTCRGACWCAGRLGGHLGSLGTPLPPEAPPAPCSGRRAAGKRGQGPVALIGFFWNREGAGLIRPARPRSTRVGEVPQGRRMESAEVLRPTRWHSTTPDGRRAGGVGDAPRITPSLGVEPQRAGAELPFRMQRSLRDGRRACERVQDRSERFGFR